MANYWQQVMTADFAVPSDRPLDDLTAELTSMLGSPDPAQRDGVAYPTLATWIERGIFDDLLVGLGDGLATGLQVGLGERDTDSVFRRSFSALALAEVIQRDNTELLVGPDVVLTWGDRVATWFLREQDLRGYVPAKGWAHSVAHGADAIAVLAASRHFGVNELTVLLDVIADRVTTEDPWRFCAGEDDRLALAVLAVLRRNLVPLKVVEPWLTRLAQAGTVMGSTEDVDPYVRANNAQSLLRATHLHLSLAAAPPAERSDLLLATAEALRLSNPFTLGAPATQP